MPRLWLVTPVYGRPALTRICFEQRARMLDELVGLGIDARQLVVGDDAGILFHASELGFIVLGRPNVLGRKVNDGIEWACREGGADFVSFCGSDDWHLASYFVDLPAPGKVRTSEWLAVVAPDGRRMIVSATTAANGNAPWIIPRELLEPSGYRPAEDARMHGIDGSIARGVLEPLQVPAPQTHRERRTWRVRSAAVRSRVFERGANVDRLRMVDFKGGGEQITPFRLIARRQPDIDTPEPFALLVTRYPLDLCERMEKFYAEKGRA